MNRHESSAKGASWGLCWVLAWFLTSCGGTTDVVRNTSAPVQTELLSYKVPRIEKQAFGTHQVSYDVSINYRFRNPVSRNVVFFWCSLQQFRLQELKDTGAWSTVWEGPGDKYCGNASKVVLPGAQFEGTLRLSAQEPVASLPQTDQTGLLQHPLKRGVFRIVLSNALHIDDSAMIAAYEQQQSCPECAPVSTETVLSNEFVLDPS